MQERNDDPAWGTKTTEGYRLYRLKMPRTHTFYSRDNAQGWKKALWHFQDYFDYRNKNIFRQLLSDVKPDHIDIHNIVGIGFNALSEVKKYKCSVAYFTHDLNMACFKGSMFKNGHNCEKQCLQCKIISHARQYHLRKINKLKFISPSKITINMLTNHVDLVRNSEVKVIRNVLDELPKDYHKLVKTEDSDKKIKLIFVGRLDPIKGVEFLLETLESLYESYKFNLKILGTGPLEKALRKKYQDASWVEFYGFVSRIVVADEIARSDLFCMPSLCAEAYGMVTAQALQIGTPIIGSNIGGTTELVRNLVTGVLVREGDKKAWQDQFVEIFENPTVLDKWRKNVIKYSEEFSSDNIFSSYRNFILKNI